jgi:5'-nucleotidase
VTAGLSSLLFSAGEPAAASGGVNNAVVKIGDTAVGTAPIDPAVVDTTDEVGRASVTFTIPAGLTGQQTLTITVPDSGTAISVPILVADATPPVEKAPSLTIGLPSTFFANHHSTLHYTVRVFASNGAEAMGTVTVFDGGTAIATAELAEGDHGRARLKLPKLSRGLHLLSVSSAGSDSVEASTSLRLPVLLW